MVFAHGHDDVVTVAHACRETGTPLVARGRGTNTTGASVPTEGGIVLSLEGMQRILDYRPADRLLVCEAGTLNDAVQARAAFGKQFVNYLARFLLAYDAPSRRLWRARAAEIPIQWNAKQVADIRMTHLGEFVGSVEAALCAFTPEQGVWNTPLTAPDAARVDSLVSLLRNRYGDTCSFRRGRLSCKHGGAVCSTCEAKSTVIARRLRPRRR